MILKQLKQFTLSATRRNAVFKTDVQRLARFYGSPAVCESLPTSKVYKRLSRDERRALVESFVNEYRAANAGRFPSLWATYQEVGGKYYIVRNIFQELKLKPKAPVPIVVKAISEVSPSVPNDASSQTLSEPQSHSSGCNAEHFSPVVVDPEFQAGSPDTIETGSDQRQATIDFSHPNSDEVDLQGNNLVITATDDKRETETTPNNDVDSKWDSNTHLFESQKIIVVEDLEVCLKNSEIGEEGNLTHLGNQEPIADHLDGAAVTHLGNQEPKADHLEGAAVTHLGNQEPKADHLEGAAVTHLGNQEPKADHLEGAAVTHLGNQEPKADHLEGAAVMHLGNQEPKADHLEGAAVTHLGNQEPKADHLEGAAVTHLGNQEPKADRLEGAAVSADVVPTETTETRQVSETGAGEVKEIVAGEVKDLVAGEVKERSSAWSNIMSFAKEFANFWR